MLGKIPHRDEIIIGDYLYGRVGKQRGSKTVVQSLYKEEVTNDSGELDELKISNTFFHRKEIHKFTKYQHSIIDYQIVRI